MNMSNPIGIRRDLHVSEFYNQTENLLGDQSDKMSNRVTLKIDVSHTDHSHVIGHRGDDIKRVTRDTQCHIHFPDCNRDEFAAKSNQVSISGQLENVEKGRRIIREMQPITFTLEIPYLSDDRLRADQNSPLIQLVKHKYNVKITFLNNYPLKNCKTRISVQGLAINSINTEEAVKVIMNAYLSENKGGFEVYMEMAMDSYSSFELFNQISREDLIQLVKKTTDAKICYITSSSSFPSSSLPHNSNSILRPPSPSISLNQQKYYQSIINSSNINQNSNISKFNLIDKYSPSTSQVNEKISLNAIHIYGKVNSLFSARQLIMNLMPVGLMFDVNITGGEEWLNSLNLTNLCRFYDVSLTTRPTKSREFWKTVALRTTERNISSMYIVCRRIRDLLLDNAKAIDNSIYASKSLNSMSYQLNSDKLWPNDIFKSNNQYKEVERFSNRGRMTFDNTEGCSTINQEEGNKENMTLIAPPLSSYSTPATTSMKPIVNTINNNPFGGGMNSCRHHHHHEKDGLRLMSYESNAEWQLKSDSIVTDNNRIWKGYDDFNRSLNIQANETYTKMDDKPSSQTRSILTNRNIQNNS